MKNLEEKIMKEFDKEFKYLICKEKIGSHNVYCDLLHKEEVKYIKSFILSALSQMREKTIDDCLSLVPPSGFNEVITIWQDSIRKLKSKKI